MPWSESGVEACRIPGVFSKCLSQVVEIAEMIRTKQIPLLMENVIDVTHKLWLVHPARRYQGTAPLDRLKVLRGPNISLEELDCERRSLNGMDKHSEAFVIDHVPKYITRPQHKQPSFSAFLIKLRKLLSTSMNHVI
ncbi:tRNA (adenine(58)-N(1))-methyltransferase, mitochondrial [Holothuria leucospilota]|uniref:tRNA (Adenine(58)-N(1))-methyltransferase, mitochondrial n=1 Tax=Holothuria leucospilota TaxID=206669 RepID=A0A9Q1CJF3_HOLLE|nr:tRNA (adenine(58)-N(1))-methyltransferase, mitochondrial [Holothuria leucospilota]